SIDRLRQDAAYGAPVELAIDAVEAKGDGDDRDEKGEEGDERGQRFARDGKNAQEYEWVLPDRLLDLTDGGVDRGGARQDHQHLHESHPHTQEIVGQLALKDRAEARPG